MSLKDSLIPLLNEVRIDGQLETLIAHGLSPEQATDMIVLDNLY